MADPDDNPVPRTPEVQGAKWWFEEMRRLLALTRKARK